MKYDQAGDAMRMIEEREKKKNDTNPTAPFVLNLDSNLPITI